MLSYWRKVTLRAWTEAWQEVVGHTWRSVVIYLVMSAVSIWMQTKWLGIVPTLENLRVFAISLAAGLLIFIPLFMVKFVRAPYKLDQDRAAVEAKLNTLAGAGTNVYRSCYQSHRALKFNFPR